MLPTQTECRQGNEACTIRRIEKEQDTFFEKYKHNMLVAAVCEPVFPIFHYSCLHTFAVFTIASTTTAMFLEKFSHVPLLRKIEENAFSLKKKVPHLTAIIYLQKLRETAVPLKGAL